jgi:hypothetical protein
LYRVYFEEWYWQVIAEHAISQPLIRDLVEPFNGHKGGCHDRWEEHDLEWLSG